MEIVFLIILVGGFNFFFGGGAVGWFGLGVANTPGPCPSQPELYLQKTNIAQTCTDENVWNAMQSMAM